jgi:hypothetical protein
MEWFDELDGEMNSPHTNRAMATLLGRVWKVVGPLVTDRDTLATVKLLLSPQRMWGADTTGFGLSTAPFVPGWVNITFQLNQDVDPFHTLALWQKLFPDSTVVSPAPGRYSNFLYQWI